MGRRPRVVEVPAARCEHRVTRGEPHVQHQVALFAAVLARSGVKTFGLLDIAGVPLQQAKLELQRAQDVLLASLPGTLNRGLQSAAPGLMVVGPKQDERQRSRRRFAAAAVRRVLKIDGLRQGGPLHALPGEEIRQRHLAHATREQTRVPDEACGGERGLRIGGPRSKLPAVRGSRAAFLQDPRLEARVVMRVGQGVGQERIGGVEIVGRRGESRHRPRA